MAARDLAADGVDSAKNVTRLRHEIHPSRKQDRISLCHETV